ncbi:selenocysteine-specific translation elongation factor [uncultured Sulfitobacter sp.]|jgi:selenocysteine-specific elongation factor|uniref:selenocysteine-specific translation elongation factor n=1 Tax=Sulfitobacter sp. SH22 TaxID=3421172 RepID=UPI0025E02650|nr:selenocysteine-specific translation elongation factor [uncultured Sulfitobacter sp.]
MTSACVIVIGHVDHGKTTVVRGLTGMETDTLPQEKQRGLSINLGFAYCRYPSGTVDLIDAPGHEDFIRAMVAGASGAQAALLVVSAVDGVAPQTIEHLRIARLLGVPVRFVAVTKVDLLPAGDLETRLEAIRETLRGLGLGDVPLIPVSTHLETGMQTLHKGLEGLLGDVPVAQHPKAGFLPIDRVFTMPGLGTVVTGTLLGGNLSLSDAVKLLPQDRPVTLRGVQVRGTARDHATRGERTAVNLRGIAADDITRGDVLCAGADFAAARCMDVRLSLLDDAPSPLKHMSDVRVLFGTTHTVATLRLMGGGQVVQGNSAFAQLRFDKPVAAFAGQRMILRALSPAQTIGGAVVLDPHSLGVKSGDAARLAVMQAAAGGRTGDIVAALCVQGRGCADLSEAARIARQNPASVLAALGAEVTQIAPGWIALSDTIQTAQADLLQSLKTFHAEHPIKRFAPRGMWANRKQSPWLSHYVEQSLANEGAIRLAGDQIALASHDPAAALTQTQRDRLGQIESQFKEGGTVPPGLGTVLETGDDPDLLAILMADETLVALTNVALNQQVVFHSRTLVQSAQTLRDAFPPPMSFTTGQARAALHTSRKFIVPLLEHFDTIGVTQRQGDTRQMAPLAD